VKINLKAIFLLCLFINTLIAQELEEVSLQLKWKYQFQFAGFIAAVEKGFYKDAGLDVKLLEYTNKTDTIKDMMDGKIQFGVSDSALMLEALKGVPITGLMAMYQQSPYILMSLKSSNIKTIKDIEGKRVAIYDDVNGDAIKSMLKINNISFIQKPIDEKLIKLKNKEIDLAISYISNEPYIAKEMGMDVRTLKLNDDGFERYGDILFTLKDTVKNNPILVEKMRKATKKGFEYAFTHIDEMISIIQKKYNTLNKSKDALRYEADTLFKMSSFGNNYGELKQSRVESIAYIYSYTDTVKYDKSNLDDFIYKPNDSQLSSSELQWLKENHTVKIKVDNYPPFQMIKNGKFEGISVDYIEKIFKKHNIKYKFISTTDIGTWNHALTSIRDKKEIDLILAAKNTPLRQKDMLFTDNYMSSPWVIFTRDNSNFISGIKELEGKTISVENGFVIHKLLQTKYPQINLKLIEGLNPTQHAMKALAVGEVDAYIGNLTIGSYIAKSLSLDNIKVASPTPFGNHENAMALRDDWSPLVSIINRELRTMSSQDKNKIYNKYLSIKYEYGISFEDVLKWIAIVSFVLGSIVIVVSITNRRLKKEIKKRKIVESQLFELNNTLENKIEIEIEKNTKQQVILMQQSKLVQMGEMMENIAHQWRQPLAQINSSVLLIDIALAKENIQNSMTEKKLLEIEDLTAYMSKTIDDFRSFFDPNKKKTVFTVEDAFNKSYNIVKGHIVSRHIKVIIDIEQNLKCDSYLDELQQVFLTLLNNAIDALITQAIKLPKICIKAFEKEKDIIIEIQDNALGIDNEIINKIFEPYFTTKHKTQGTGLGLYMAKMIIESGLQGSLSVENRLDGACFIIVVPQGKI
jgi:signal transduction histidine kinase/ABC-type nitrate/sulfonate/bicarbonate transport system substrate-binding protein